MEEWIISLCEKRRDRLTREKVTSELLRVREQMEKLRKKEKQLLDQKKEMDEIEILKITKRIGITPEQLQLLNSLNEKEIKEFLRERRDAEAEKEMIEDGKN